MHSNVFISICCKQCDTAMATYFQISFAVLPFRWNACLFSPILSVLHLPSPVCLMASECGADAASVVCRSSRYPRRFRGPYSTTQLSLRPDLRRTNSSPPPVPFPLCFGAAQSQTGSSITLT